MFYVDLPVLIQYNLNSPFSFYAGLQPSLLLDAKRKFKSPNLSDTQKATDEFKKFDLAAAAGVGYQINNAIGLKLLYHHGLTNIHGTSSYGGPGSYRVSTGNSSISMTVVVDVTGKYYQYDRQGNRLPTKGGTGGVLK